MTDISKYLGGEVSAPFEDWTVTFWPLPKSVVFTMASTGDSVSMTYATLTNIVGPGFENGCKKETLQLAKGKYREVVAFDELEKLPTKVIGQIINKVIEVNSLAGGDSKNS